MTDTVEPIEDVMERAQVQRQARAIQLKALVVAILLTLIVLVLPRRSR